MYRFYWVLRVVIEDRQTINHHRCVLERMFFFLMERRLHSDSFYFRFFSFFPPIRWFSRIFNQKEGRLICALTSLTRRILEHVSSFFLGSFLEFIFLPRNIETALLGRDGASLYRSSHTNIIKKMPLIIIPFFTVCVCVNIPYLTIINQVIG